MATEIKESWNEYNKPFIYQRADPYVYKAPDGTYYFTASVPAYDKIILRHADPMKDAWIEKGKMQRADEDQFSFEAFSLDATILKTVQVLLTTPDYDWERVAFWVNEGPAMLKHDGKLYLTFSASGTGACYCMGMLTAEEDSDLLDPRSWSKDRYPVCKTDYEKMVFGPGHNCFVKNEDNTKDICVFHARSYEKIVGDSLYDPNRHALLMEVAYDQSGRPVFKFQKQQ